MNKKKFWLVIAIVWVFIGLALCFGLRNSTGSTPSTGPREAAEQGDAESQYELGVMCANGDGVTKDEVQAVKGDLSKVKLSDKPTELLGDRLRVHMPEGSKAEARSVSVMAAEESSDEETRIVFDLDKKRLVLMVYETFTTAPKDFAAEAKKIDKEESKDGKTVKSKLIIDRKGYRVFQRLYDSVDTSSETILITSAWVVNTDNTIQFIAGYANPAAASELQDVQSLYAQIFKTLEPGKKQLLVKAREQSLSIHSKKKTLMVKLPDGWVCTVQRGPDFLVHSLRKVTPLVGDSPSIGVYVGWHPRYHYRSGNTEPKESQGTLIGEKADWFKVSSNESLFMEAMRRAKEIDEHTIFHVWISSSSEKGLGAAKTIVDSMRIVDKPKAKKNREQEDALDKE